MHRPPQPGPQAVEGQDRSGPPPPTGGTMPKTAAKTSAKRTDATLPPAGWGESSTGKPTFVEISDSLISAPPALEGHYPWWVSRHTGFTRWIYKPNA